MSEESVELDSSKCPNCGSPLQGEDDSTFLYCPNEDCPVIRIYHHWIYKDPITLKE